MVIPLHLSIHALRLEVQRDFNHCFSVFNFKLMMCKHEGFISSKQLFQGFYSLYMMVLLGLNHCIWGGECFLRNGRLPFVLVR